MMVRETSLTPKILLVDDEIQQLSLRAQVMKLFGFPVLTANDPIQAISILAEEEQNDKIDLVILDYNMPGMNGCDLADELKAMVPGLKIILYSGSGDIPGNATTSIDSFVSKSDGVSALVKQVAELGQFPFGCPDPNEPDTEQRFRTHGRHC